MNKVVIFDLDGTILDTIEDITNAMNFALEKFGFSLVSTDEMKNYVGGPAKEMAKSAIKVNVSDSIINSVANYYLFYMNNHCHKFKIFDGVEKVIKKLKDNDYKICVFSNKTQEEVDALMKNQLKQLNLDCAIGVSSLIKEKPHPDGVFYIMNKYKALIDNVYFVGDGETDVLTAKNSGAKCIAVLWGNRKRELLEKFGAKNFACKPIDILKFIG